MSIKIGNKKSKLYIGNTKVSKAYLGSTKIYSSGNTVTYIVDAKTYMEEVDEGMDVLHPKSFFTPSKSGYTFVGWSLTSGGSTLTSLSMGDNSITLYAIYTATSLTVTGNSNYVTTSGQLRAGVWYQSGRDQNTGYVHISYGAYKKVTIVFEISISNIFGEEEGLLTIAGVSVVNTRDDKRPSTYTYTGSATTIPLVFLVDNNIDDNGWSEIGVTIKSVVLSM